MVDGTSWAARLASSSFNLRSMRQRAMISHGSPVSTLFTRQHVRETLVMLLRVMVRLLLLMRLHVPTMLLVMLLMLM